MDSAVTNLKDTVLISPLDGMVTARNQDPGGLATPSQPILTLQTTNEVWITLAVPEDVATKIHLQQPVTAVFDALGGKQFAATIAQINPAADMTGRQFTVRLLLNNPDSSFRSGMFARVTMVTEKDHVLAVPLEAVHQNDDQANYVIVPGQDSKAVFQPVTTGASDDKWIAVTGLTPGTKVVTMSATAVREGQKIGAGKRGTKGPGGAAGAPAPGGVNAPAPADAGTTPSAAGHARPAQGQQ